MVGTGEAAAAAAALGGEATQAGRDSGLLDLHDQPGGERSQRDTPAPTRQHSNASRHPFLLQSTAERVVGVTQVAYALSNFPLELLPQGEFHLGGCGLPGSQGLTEEQ